MRGAAGEVWRGAIYCKSLQKSGNFVNGIINGQGKEYDEKGSVKYIGTYEAGVKNGFIVEYKTVFVKSKNSCQAKL